MQEHFKLTNSMAIEKHIIVTNAGKQLSQASALINTGVEMDNI
jgi:hypothetical protein